MLSRSERLPRAASAAEAFARLRPGIDGVTLHWRGRRATLLPQVWASLPRREDFAAALWRKAGLAAGFWADDVELGRYTVRRFEGRAAEVRRLA